jgi:hypothetical protein
MANGHIDNMDLDIVTGSWIWRARAALHATPIAASMATPTTTLHRHRRRAGSIRRAR